MNGDQPFLESLRFPIPDQCIKSGPISITLAKFHVGSVDLRRLRVDMLQDQLAISFENPEADITGSYSILLKDTELGHASSFYAKLMPGGHGSMVLNVKLTSEGRFESLDVHDCRMFQDFNLKIEHALLGPLADFALGALRGLISKIMDEQVCNLVKLALTGQLEMAPLPDTTCPHEKE